MAGVVARQTTMKDQRLNIRTSAELKTILEEPARATRVSVSEFVLRAAVQAAEHVLAEQTQVVLSPRQWDEFIRIPDRPAREISTLRQLAVRPNPFGER